MAKTFSIKTLGCKLNQYESSLIAAQFVANGWTSRPFGKEVVDIVIINTCTVTDRSDKKCRNYIRQGSRFSESGRVFVAGCMVDGDSAGIENMPEVGRVFKNSEKGDILSCAEKATSPENKRIADKDSDVSDSLYPFTRTRTRGFIKVQDGCDGVCSYCIVPSVRGGPVSRDPHEIINHVKALAARGCPEIVLTGITTGKYLYNGMDFSGLVKEILSIPGSFRVRISSIEPNHITDSLTGLFTNDRLCPHLHIPLQSGSDKILKAMRRRYSAGEYLEIIESIRRDVPDIALSADIIIGFPGEEETDFVESLRMVEKARFSYVHQFTFSPRSGTGASGMIQNAGHKEIKDRARRMRELSGRVGLEYREKYAGRELPSVIEKNRNRAGYSAVSDNYIRMELEESPLNLQMEGKITKVRLLECGIKGNKGVIAG